MPLRAETAVEMAMTSGMARPSACGHAMTSTVTVRSTASVRFPINDQTTNVIRPTPDANQNSAAAARSARA
jgi:hypothetical protein